jgi:hypothetical protein
MEDRDVAFPDLVSTMRLPMSGPEQAFFGVYDGHEGDGVSAILAETLHVHVTSAAEFHTDPVAALMTGFQVPIFFVKFVWPPTLRAHTST